MNIITKEQMLEALEQVVAERGEDYRYTPPGERLKCRYEYRGEPSCGVGLALSKLGVPVSVLAEMDATIFSSIAVVGPILEAYGSALSPSAIGVASRFQTRQDLRASYRMALAVAKGESE